MASQKRTRATSSGPAGNGGTAARSGSGSSGNRGGTKQAGRGQNARTQNTRTQNARAQNASGQNSRVQNARGQNGRAQDGRTGPDGANGSARVGTLTVEPAAEARYGAPTWLRWTTLVLSLAGLGVSVYLTIAHYTTPNILVCSSNGLIDCVKVTKSAQSMVFGVFPVAVLGLAFYIFMVAINTPRAWRAQLPAIWWARLGSVIVGIGFVLYLLFVEIIQLGNICLWCTSVHVITFLLFGLIVFAASTRPTPAR